MHFVNAMHFVIRVHNGFLDLQNALTIALHFATCLQNAVLGQYNALAIAKHFVNLVEITK